MYVGVISLRNLLNKLYIICLLWYDILDSKDKLSNLFKKSSYALMWHYTGRNKFVMSSQFLCHIKAGWFLTTNCLFVWNVIFCRIIITPLYMCATQTTLNRLKQPKNFYSVHDFYMCSFLGRLDMNNLCSFYKQFAAELVCLIKPNV